MNSESLVQSYLDRLEADARRLPAGRAAELVDEIRGHIDLALVEAGDRDEATVRTVLDRLGPAEAIVDAEIGAAEDRGAEASAASPRTAARPARGWGGIEIVAALLLTAGMILLPVVGPLLGVGLAWLSSYWTTREKIVVTAVVLVLLVVPMLGLLTADGGSDVTSGTSEPVQTRP